MATFLLEVGTEELPASFLDTAFEQWRSRIPTSLTEAYLTPESIELYGTPRRLAVVIKGLPTQQPDRNEEIKGPPAKAAFKDGKPTKAAEGFARSRGVSVDDFEIRETEKGEFIFVTQEIAGRPVTDLLTELVPDWIFGLEGKRFMRWGNGDLRFPRPIRWLVTLIDDDILPITIDNASDKCTSDRLSYGHRILAPGAVTIATAENYVETLRHAFVEVDPTQRKAVILEQTHKAAKSVQGEALISESLLQEVINLVEYPTAVIGTFDPAFLEIPAEVTITEMESHQRYFPVINGSKQQPENDRASTLGSIDLLPYFITISNGDPNKSDIIAAGNARVIRARLSDGKFFFDADRKVSLADYLPQLETVTFQRDLGSVRAKVDRIVSVAQSITQQLNLESSDCTIIERAALLCKADLVTQMVGEFPELQGVMGQKYAIASHEPQAVADAIVEHYLPKGADDDLPQTLAGQVVGLSDRIDTLVSIFSLGMIPSGSSDPFALRRAANAVVNIIWSGELALNLQEILANTVNTFSADRGITPANAATLQSQLEDFFSQRLRSLFQEEQNIDYDLMNAVLGEDDPELIARALVNVLDVRDRAQFLQSIRTNGDLNQIYETVNRASRLAKQGELNTNTLNPDEIIAPALFQQPSEQAFYDAVVKLVPKTETAQANRDYRTLVEALADIAPIVSTFFDGPDSVLVMDEDLAVRKNRLNLLGLLRNHARVLADFGAIVKG